LRLTKYVADFIGFGANEEAAADPSSTIPEFTGNYIRRTWSHPASLFEIKKINKDLAFFAR
jgi:hypothetical protein